MKKVSTWGFTLIEVITAVAISSIVLVALVRLLGTSIPQYRSLFLQTLVSDTARVQLKRISHILREARSSDTGAYAIVEATPSKIVFYANIDEDTATERIRYELIGTNLVRGITNPSGNPIVYDTTGEAVSIVARSITNGTTPLFTYYGNTYPTDPNPLILPTPTP